MRLHKMQDTDGVQAKEPGAHQWGVVKGVGHSGTMLMGRSKFGGKGGVQTKIGKIPGKHYKECHVPNGALEMTSCRSETGCIVGMATSMVGKGVAKRVTAGMHVHV